MSVEERIEQMKRLTRKKQNEIINLVFENNKIMKNLYITTDGVDKRLKDKYDENSEDLEEKYFPQILKEYANINILGILPDYGNIANLTPDTLIADILNKVKIEEIFGLEIAKLRG